MPPTLATPTVRCVIRMPRTMSERRKRHTPVPRRRCARPPEGTAMPSGGGTQVPLHGPAGAAQFGGNGLDGPAVGLEPRRLNGPIRYRLFRLQAQGTGYTIAFVRAKPAVPATTQVWVFVSQGERQAGKAGSATGAAGNNGSSGRPSSGWKASGSIPRHAAQRSCRSRGLRSDRWISARSSGSRPAKKYGKPTVLYSSSADVRPPIGLG